MSRTVTLMATFVLAAAALAGCTMGGNDGQTTTTTTTTATTTTPTTTTQVTSTPPTTPTPTLSNSTFVIATSGVPAQVKVGQKFNFTVTATGSTAYATDHIGAHYANNTTNTPVATAMKSCDHGVATLPAAIMTNCTFDAPGTWHVYGHARGIEGNQTYDWWAAPTEVKARAFTLNLTGAPSTPPLGNSSFTLTLAINGTENVTSDHIGAHWFNTTTADPTVATSAGACTHVTGPSVNTHAIECKIPNTGAAPRAVQVYGHLRIVEGGITLDWWSGPVEVTIGPQLPI